MEYRTRCRIVQAIQFTGKNFKACDNFVQKDNISVAFETDHDDRFLIHQHGVSTENGHWECQKGDWIVKEQRCQRGSTPAHTHLEVMSDEEFDRQYTDEE